MWGKTDDNTIDGGEMSCLEVRCEAVENKNVYWSVDKNECKTSTEKN